MRHWRRVQARSRAGESADLTDSGMLKHDTVDTVQYCMNHFT